MKTPSFPAARSMTYSIAMMLFLAISAVAAAPQFTDADFGPLPRDHETIAARYISKQLKDPLSARIRLALPPAKMPYAYGLHPNIRHLPVWSVSLLVNAKNSFGGYTGDQLHTVYLHRGEPVGYVAP